MDLEERVRRLEHRAELNDLIVAYFLASDDDDPAGIAESFTRSATFSSSGRLVADGREAIVAFIKTSRERMGLTVHTPHYAHFRFEGPDAASGLVGAHLELVVGGDSLVGAVRYLDRYRRVDGRWRIEARDMRTVHIAPWTDLPESFASETPVRWPGTAAAPSDFPRKPGTSSTGV